MKDNLINSISKYYHLLKQKYSEESGLSFGEWIIEKIIETEKEDVLLEICNNLGICDEDKRD